LAALSAPARWVQIGYCGQGKPHGKVKKPMQVSIETTVQGQSSPDYHLVVTLTNHSASALTTYEHALPWVGHNSMLLVAVKADAVGTIIEKDSPVDDPGPATVTIPPGQTSTGTIPLVSRFPGFLEALAEREVIVFWSYQCQPVGSAPLPRVAGYVLFPKSTTE
jgi:hypothetical protein